MKKLLLIVLITLSLQASAQYTSTLPTGYTPFATQMYYKITAGDTTFVEGASGKGYHIIAANQAVKDSLANYYTKVAADARFVPLTRSLTINGTSQDLSANRTWSVGTVTSVAALTLGTTGTDLSSSVATGTTTPVITLNVPTASVSNRGALSAVDWATFNNKAPTATPTFTGLLTAADIAVNNYLFNNNNLNTLGTSTGNKPANIYSYGYNLSGSTSGMISVLGQAAAGTYNFNLPITAGTSGQVLTSAGGVAAPMTWSTPTTGTVTAIGVTTANGVSGTSSGSATPSLTITLGAITPSSVVASGSITGSNLSGTNTGDQTIALTGDITGSGTGSFATNIANGAVTNAKLATSTISGIPLGSNLATLTFGTYLTGTSYNGSTGVTIATNAVTTGAASTLAARDGSAGLTASMFTADGSEILRATNQATSAVYINLSNTSGGTLLGGIYNSSGTGFGATAISGMTALASGFGTTTNTPYQIFTNSIVRQTISGSGATTFAGTLAASNLSGTNTGDQNLSTYALLASPALTGTPTAPTAAGGTNTTQLATTAFVTAAVGSGGVTGTGTTNYLPIYTGTNTIGNSHWIQSGYSITPDNNSNQLIFSGNTTLIGAAIVLPGGSGTNADAPTIRMGNTGKTVATMTAQTGGVGIGFLAYSSDFGGTGNIKRYGTIGIDGNWYLGNDDGSTVTYGTDKLTVVGTLGVKTNSSTANSVAVLNYSMLNSASAVVNYAGIEAFLVANTAGAEYGRLDFYVNSNAVRTKGMTLDQGGNINAFGLIINNKAMRLKGYTVATLPAGTQGDTLFCTDLTTPTSGSTAVGGGAVVRSVFFNGTNWIVQ